MLYVGQRPSPWDQRRDMQLSEGHLIRIIFATIIAMIIGCGGPPQNPSLDDGEGPAVLALNFGSSGDFGSIPNLLETQNTIEIINLSFNAQATGIAVTEGLVMPFTFTGGGYPGTGGTCGTSLAAGASCLIVLSALPTTINSFSDQLTLSYNDSVADQSLDIAVSATSRPPIPGTLTISDGPTYDFGLPAVGSINDYTFTVTNAGEFPSTGITPMALNPPFSFVGGSYPGTGGDCGATVSTMTSCTIVVRFAPTTTALVTDTITLNYNDGLAPQTATRPMQGEARIAANLVVVEGTTFNFGIVNNSFFMDQTLTIQNTGLDPASALSFNGLAGAYGFVGGTYPGTGGNCGTTLSAAASCTINIRFAPTTTGGHPLSPNLQYNDGFLVQTINFSLSGTGFANAPTVVRSNPATTPNNNSSPTVQVGNLIAGVTIHLYDDTFCGNEIDNQSALGATYDFNPTVLEGSYDFHVRIEDDYGNLSTCSAASAGYEYDNTPPNPVTNVVMTAPYTTSATATPTFTWTHSSSSDRTDYEVGLSINAAGGNDRGGWQSKGLVTSTSITSGITLSECEDLYASVQVIDQVGLTSTVAAAATTFRYDSAIPTTPSGLSVDGDATQTNSATTYWNASSDNCGIDHYEIAISQDTNGNLALDPGEVGNVVAFKDVGLVTQYRENGLLLTTAVNYYTSVRAVDTTGRYSNQAVSSPYIIYNPSIELPDMIVWLDAADLTSVLDSGGRNANNPAFNGSVRTWQDKSGSPVIHNFTTTGGAADPGYDDLNYSLQFDGATTGMTTGDHPEINTATVTQRNITVAFRTPADISSRQIVYEEGGTIRGMNIYIFNGRLYCGFFNTPAGDGDGVQNFTSVNTVITPNTNYFATWVFDYTNYTGPSGPDGNLDCYVNNTHIGNVPTTSRLFAHSGNVGLGHIDNGICFEDSSCPNSGANFLGDIYEVMLFNDAPDATDVSNVHTYLDNKWN